MYIYWLVVEPTPLKNMKVSWDDDIPNRWENKSHVPNHQPVYMYIYIYIHNCVKVSPENAWGSTDSAAVPRCMCGLKKVSPKC